MGMYTVNEQCALAEIWAIAKQVLSRGPQAPPKRPHAVLFYLKFRWGGYDLSVPRQ